VLHVTSVAVAEEHLTTIPYSIGDLIDAGYDTDTLDVLIEDTVAPDAWDSVGGPGVVSFLGDVMFVRQTDGLHREVSGLLAALREHGRRTFAFDPPQHLRLREKLDENVSVAFRDTPLEAAVEQLAEKTQIDIRLDKPALDSVKVRQRQPITLSLADRKLKTVLQAMLIDLDLSWMLRDGVLWVTTRDEVESFCKTAVYDVRDLCRDGGESESLEVAILSQTGSDWDDVGGIGSMESPRPGTLVVYNTEDALDEVLNLLETYRTALRSSKPRQKPEEDPNQIVTVYYRMHANVAEGLAKLLPRLVRPESWKTEDQPEAPGDVILAPSVPDLSEVNGVTESASQTKGSEQSARTLVIARAVLIIRQTRAVHDEIEKVIRRVESGDPQMDDEMMGMGGMGGGMGGGGAALPSSTGGGFGGGFFSVPAQKTGLR
jgi:hypothetical protein